MAAVSDLQAVPIFVADGAKNLIAITAVKGVYAPYATGVVEVAFVTTGDVLDQPPLASASHVFFVTDAKSGDVTPPPGISCVVTRLSIGQYSVSDVVFTACQKHFKPNENRFDAHRIILLSLWYSFSRKRAEMRSNRLQLYLTYAMREEGIYSTKDLLSRTMGGASLLELHEKQHALLDFVRWTVEPASSGVPATVNAACTLLNTGEVGAVNISSAKMWTIGVSSLSDLDERNKARVADELKLWRTPWTKDAKTASIGKVFVVTLPSRDSPGRKQLQQTWLGVPFVVCIEAADAANSLQLALRLREFLQFHLLTSYRFFVSADLDLKKVAFEGVQREVNEVMATFYSQGLPRKRRNLYATIRMALLAEELAYFQRTKAVSSVVLPYEAALVKKPLVGQRLVSFLDENERFERVLGADAVIVPMKSISAKGMRVALPAADVGLWDTLTTTPPTREAVEFHTAAIPPYKADSDLMKYGSHLRLGFRNGDYQALAASRGRSAFLFQIYDGQAIGQLAKSATPLQFDQHYDQLFRNHLYNGVGRGMGKFAQFGPTLGLRYLAREDSTARNFYHANLLRTAMHLLGVVICQLRSGGVGTERSPLWQYFQDEYFFTQRGGNHYPDELEIATQNRSYKGQPEVAARNFLRVFDTLHKDQPFPEDLVHPLERHQRLLRLVRREEGVVSGLVDYITQLKPFLVESGHGVV